MIYRISGPGPLLLDQDNMVVQDVARFCHNLFFEGVEVVEVVEEMVK